MEIYKKIYLKYPQLVNVNFQILNNQGVAMNKSKTIGDYGIDYNSSTVTAHGIPGYLFGSDGIIKLMKVSGEWVYDETMINFLNLQNFIKENSPKYGNKTGKTMTASVVNYLQATYPHKADEYKLIYRKVNKFLSQ